MTVLLLCRLPTRSVDRLNQVLSECEGFLGYQERPDQESSLFQVPAEFEILEFGTEAALRYESYVRQNNKQKWSILDLYFEHDPQNFLSQQQKIQELQIQILEQIICEDLNYIEEYKKHAEAAEIENLWIGPPWKTPPSGKEIFFVDPGMAFGTGDHPTTQLCLLRLWEWSQQSLTQQSKINPKIKQTKAFADIGTGTGVLALAAQRFFKPTRLDLFDTDPLCENEVTKTFALNQASTQGLGLYFGTRGYFTQDIAESRYDVVISNIYAEVLLTLTPAVIQSLKSKGLWLVSGVLGGAPRELFVNQVIQDFDIVWERSLQRPEPSTHGGFETWHCLELQKRA